MSERAPRIWTIGDPEPEDHPEVVAGDDGEHMPGPWHYRWEPPAEHNGWHGGWWSVEFAGDLWSWEDLLVENGTLTERLDEGATVT